jgi:hypothetical protein
VAAQNGDVSAPSLMLGGDPAVLQAPMVDTVTRKTGLRS